MIGQFSESPLKGRLEEQAGVHGLDYLAYVFVPASGGGEGLMVAFGSPPAFAHCRQVQVAEVAGGRAELHWSVGGSLPLEQAAALLEQLDNARRDEPSALSRRLHETVCQSLTVAHLQLELGLMMKPEAGEEFVLAREMVQEASASMRELINELAGGQP